MLMRAIEKRGQLALVTLDLAAFAVTVEVALGSVVGFTMRVMVDRT